MYIGEIRLFAGNYAPQGWALCNGQHLPIAGHQALFAAIGTTYGGDGTTTFALPDVSHGVAVSASPDYILASVGQVPLAVTAPRPLTTIIALVEQEFPMPFLGEVRTFSFPSAPLGWTACDGQIYPILEYTALYELIGASYGGDGVSTWAVPDLRGNWPPGWSTSDAVASPSIGFVAMSYCICNNGLYLLPS